MGNNRSSNPKEAAVTPPPQPHAKDLKAIEDYIYSSMNHTEEWRAAEQAYQNILAARSRPAPSPQFKKINFNGGKCCCDDYFNCHDCRDDRQFNKAHDTHTRTTERNATLTDVIAILNEHAMIDENNQYYLWLEDAECAVESLRTKEQL